MPKTTFPSVNRSDGTGFSWGRVLAVLLKELLQLRRDRLTFAMLVGVPLMQLLLFGYAINADPKGLPTALVTHDSGPMVRGIAQAAANTGYFHITHEVSESESEHLLASGKVQFVMIFPADFTHRLVRGEKPSVVVLADASDPSSGGPAMAALSQLPAVALRRELTGALATLAQRPAPFDLIVHRRYNPEGISAFNVVPGLLGVILTMTLVLMTSMAMTRERERGTLENLLSTPVRPLEMMVGKVLPYVIIGYVQVAIVLLVARTLFSVPMAGSIVDLMAAVGLFIVTTLTVGFTFSTIARSQMQSMQMTVFYFLPNLLLSGFMFPFHGMPRWAQWIGEILPLTHFLRMVRAIMLKGTDLLVLWPQALAMAGFLLLMGTVALLRYRQTLD